jgi:hypothetical protein
MKLLGKFSWTLIAARRRQSAATLLAVVVVVLFAIALISAIQKRKARTDLEFRLSKVIKRLPSELCKQRDIIETAIERYKSELGFYPPDRIVSSNPMVVDPVTNQLMYELFGTRYDPTNGNSHPSQFPVIRGPIAKRFFNVERFKNSVENPQTTRRFLEVTNVAAIFPVYPRPDMVGLLGYWPNWGGMDADLYQFVNVAPWQYNSSRPIHNPGRFDLWIVVETSRTNITVGNW